MRGRPGKLNRARLAVLIAAMNTVQECPDCPAGLSAALDAVRGQVPVKYGIPTGRRI